MSAKRGDKERVAMAKLAGPKKPLAPIERHSWEPSDDPHAPQRCRVCGHTKRNGVHN